MESMFWAEICMETYIALAPVRWGTSQWYISDILAYAMPFAGFFDDQFILVQVNPRPQRTVIVHEKP